MLQLRLETRQTQKIVITPQLRQAIKLLQLSAIDLQSYIENEVRENPLLLPSRSVPVTSRPGRAPEMAVNANGEADIPAFDARDVSKNRDQHGLGAGNPRRPRSMKAKPRFSYDAGGEWIGSTRSGPLLGDDYDPFATVASVKSLADHLNEQAQLAFAIGRRPSDRPLPDRPCRR